METPPNQQHVADGVLTTRRTTRSALAEIPARISNLTVVENARVPTPTLMTPGMNGGGVLNVSINACRTDVSPTPSPDEEIIRQRGRRKLPVTWSPDIDRREGLTIKDGTPIKMNCKDSPKSTIVLRSTPRKRLLLNDIKDISGPSPEKCSRKSNSPIKKVRIDKQLQLTAAQSPTITTVTNQLQTTLKGLSQEQLVGVIESMLKKYPNLETEVIDSLPAPDIKPLEEKLSYLKKNIFKSLPNSRLTSKTDSPAYSRAATHVVAFKKCVLEQGRTLLESQHWVSVLEYVTVAWGYVKATPLWDNPPHNAARKQCFKSLAVMAVTALRKGNWASEQLDDYQRKLAACDPDSEDIHACIKQISTLRRK